MPKGPIIASITKERAKAGVALAMTAGSAAVSRDSRRFPTISSPIATSRALDPRTDRCPARTAARRMIQLDGIWDAAPTERKDWPASIRQAQTVNPHTRAFPKMMEDLGYRALIEGTMHAANGFRPVALDRDRNSGLRPI